MTLDIKQILFRTITCLLVILWIYTAGSKLADYHSFKQELAGQYIFRSNLVVVSIFIITSELVAAALLIFSNNKRSGLILSFALMLVFTVYVGMVFFNYFDQVPCSCGGVLKMMGWQFHFWFNVLFTFLAGLAFWLEKDLRLKKQIVSETG